MTPVPGKSQEDGFTPGPWFQSHRKRPDGMYATEVYDTAGETIATLAWYPVKLSEGVTTTARGANARLIAAAPDLLEALTKLDAFWTEDAHGPDTKFAHDRFTPDTIALWLQIRAAIAKARKVSP